MKHALMGAAIAVLMTGLAPAGSADAQHMARLNRSAADEALAAIGLDRTDDMRISFERAQFRSGVYTFTNVVFHDIPEDDAGDDAGSDLDEDSDAVLDGLSQPDAIHVARMILDSPRLDAEGNLLLHSFTLEDVSALDAGSGFTIARIALEAPNPEMSADLGRLLRGDETEDFDSRWTLYRFGLLAMENLAVTGAEPGENFVMGVDRLAFIDYTAESLGRFEFLGLAVAAETEDGDINIGLAEVSVDGLQTSSYSGLMDALAAGADEADLAAAYYAVDAGEQMDLFDRAGIREFNLEMPGLAVTLDELVVTMQNRNDRFESRAHMGSLRLVPDSAHATGAQIATSIGLLGYDSLEMSLESNTAYDPEAGRVYTFGDNYIELRDGLRLDVAQDFGGYNEYLANRRSLSLQASADMDMKTEADAEDEAERMLEAVAPLTINRIGLRLEDRSMLERAISAGAMAQGMTPDEMRAQASLMVAAGLLGAPPEIPRALLSEVATALTSFVNQGGALIIEMVPPQRLTIGDLLAQAEAEMFDFAALGLSVSAEPPAED